MRTTLSLEDDAIEAVRTRAKARRISMGAAASELIRHGAAFKITYHLENGFPVFDVPPEFPEVTTEMVQQILEEE